MRFRDKVKKPRRPVVVYEILPPREQDGTLSSYAERISSLLSQTHIDAINIPEVHDEEGRGNRPVQNQLRAEPREFGRLLQDNVGVEAIVNRVVVHEPMAAQLQWLKETYYDYGIDNLVIKIQCPGLQEFNDFLQEFREKYGKFLSQTVTMVCTETLAH